MAWRAITLTAGGEMAERGMRTTRRRLLQGALSATAVALASAGLRAPGASTAANAAPAAAPLTRPIPSSGEHLPLVGLGSWITFNVGNDTELKDECAAVMAAFFSSGGRMIDCSPMYGSSQPTIGYGLKKLGYPKPLFSAEKVWISNASRGRAQMERSRAYWGVPRFDLMQVHNLVSWERHLDTLAAMKAAGDLRYVGVTTSHGRRHDDLERIMARRPIDFVQVTYNVADREVEQRILPLARERGIAVIINRPFRQGDLVRALSRHTLPSWAAETGAKTWAQFLLKFIIAHPAVTCAIPATTRVDHVRENLAAASGALPDEALRRKMAAYVNGL